MAKLIILKKNGIAKEIVVEETPEEVAMLGNGDDENRSYNQKPEFIILTKPGGFKITVNRRYIAYVE